MVESLEFNSEEFNFECSPSMSDATEISDTANVEEINANPCLNQIDSHNDTYFGDLEDNSETSIGEECFSPILV